METVALKAGVSITTVSHVINKTRHVSRETKDAVLRAIRDLNYQPAKMNKSSPEKGIYVGVILADAREDFFIAMIKNIESIATDYGIATIFCDSEGDPEKEEKNIGTLLERKVSGLLLAPVDADHFPKLLQNISIPVVLIDRQYESHNFMFVGINNFHSSYLGTKFLIDKGCKHIGFVGYSGPVYTVRQRILGYKASLVEFYPAVLPKVLCLNYNREDSFPLIKQFILDEKLDGLVCATSTLCYEVVEVLDTLDTGVQKNLKIICYDDNRWLDYLKYPVSVISQPIAEIGHTAMENLLQFIEQADSREMKRELLLDTTIIDRIK
ncbi:LacI family transcriptional regulator [Spirochaetia bacterium]|nr:LacI family transcriptional regulator [Spirochaetia bacterium]